VSGIPTKKGPYQEPRPNPQFEQPYEGTIGKYLYHHSPPRNRSSIRTQGLLPKDPQRASAKGSGIPKENTPVGVYLGPREHVSHSTMDIYAVDTNKVDLQHDPDDHDNYWGFHYSEKPIPPDSIKLVRKGKKPSKGYSPGWG